MLFITCGVVVVADRHDRYGTKRAAYPQS